MAALMVEFRRLVPKLVSRWQYFKLNHILLIKPSLVFDN